MFAVHGSQKLFGIPPRMPGMTMNALTWTAGGIEFVCGVLVAIGFFGGFAALLASGQMAVAYFMAHFPHNFESLVKFLPPINGGELAVMYCFVFLFIAAYGSGVWSVDSCLGLCKTKPAI
jgi:putative oxidoreductase